ncbi:DNA repair protein XRCC3 [Cricetulus griseus]|uniref:DNA repair protein XRCC3 n=1 Tax=Cricetulus griseus TaxID=10029 RepID=A0A061I2E9_CRIGR|nr:DNA repair protein XRCC3 [Cricetulus griseus]
MARLVVVDSVAAPFRCEYDAQALATRAKHLQSLGAALRRLSSTFRSPVLCINQVMETVEEQESMPRPLGAWDEHLSPALGITWANQILMRLMVDRAHEDDASMGLPRSPARTIRVLSAPHLPLSSCCYTDGPTLYRAHQTIEATCGPQPFFGSSGDEGLLPPRQRLSTEL